MSVPAVVALTSQKGGSGKTTIAMQLAAGLARRGLSVGVVDLDPQESASRWAESAPPGQPFPADVVRVGGAGTKLGRVLRALRDADAVLLDCPPSIEHPHTLAALDVAQLAIVPVVPGPTDLWSTRAIERLILQRDRLAGCLLPNRVTRTALAAEVIDVLREFELPLLDATLGQRSAYALSAVRGGSVYSLGRQAAAAQEEVERLVSAVLTRLEDHS
ncbi:MAG: AAA family ATPase [Azoarcus sp.]|nr:AAA family ATPase [Azoarcus sp.]